MSSESDRLLIQQIRQGDQAAWQKLIGRYEGRLLAFARQRLHDRSVAEDVVQEAFIGFLTSLPNYDEKRELQTYLFTICSHKITDHLRRSSRRPQIAPPAVGDDALYELVDHHRISASSAARGVERRELEQAAVARALGHLIRQWQTSGEITRLKILELLFVKGWANRDVARFLRVGEQQVANYRFAAVRKLSEHVRAAGLSAEVFPELHLPPEE
jgi:RNA polymerase sigma-70 factor (ECF subfamily)